MPSPASAATLNRLQLTASVAQLQPLRHTPVGLPALDVSLAHASTQEEAGGQRQVAVTLKAVAFGTLAERLARQALESLWDFQGFLAQARNGRGVVFHIQAFQPH
ncbi:primosomal replication protein N [Comamonas sp. NLF-1-9]|uniref:primosomal replication protein N n=1 Tax=Comamonas sp. NLF-1-9 TaxID=2853163 RepID=UPI001C43DB34|nr:primosomal replication protein N [Comamonas sp. NLF-1-9]QXL85738.1 primosomal replication protein N [Comamonas sp. NLF-1-9]